MILRFCILIIILQAPLMQNSYEQGWKERNFPGKVGSDNIRS